jgi:hypothetical protein
MHKLFTPCLLDTERESVGPHWTSSFYERPFETLSILIPIHDREIRLYTLEGSNPVLDLFYIRPPSVPTDYA